LNSPEAGSMPKADVDDKNFFQ